jgi:hypothetical protein
MNLEGHVERMGNKSNASSVLVEKSEEKNEQEDLDVDGRIIL